MKALPQRTTADIQPSGWIEELNLPVFQVENIAISTWDVLFSPRLDMIIFFNSPYRLINGRVYQIQPIKRKS